jgi:aryl sulfotransferase
VPEDRWPELVAAATFDRMKERADVLAPDTTNAIWIDNGNFFKRGGSGHWRAELSDADGDRYWDRVRSLASADVVEWAHRA